MKKTKEPTQTRLQAIIAIDKAEKPFLKRITFDCNQDGTLNYTPDGLVKMNDLKSFDFTYCNLPIFSLFDGYNEFSKEKKDAIDYASVVGCNLSHRTSPTYNNSANAIKRWDWLVNQLAEGNDIIGDEPTATVDATVVTPEPVIEVAPVAITLITTRGSNTNGEKTYAKRF